MFNKKKYEKKWEYLLTLMLYKIDKVSGVFIVNNKVEEGDKEGYIGEHTKEEILYTILTKGHLNDKDWWKYVNSIYPINFEEILQVDYVEEKINKWNNIGKRYGLGNSFYREEIINNIKAIF